jgi:hypothetical protein
VWLWGTFVMGGVSLLANTVCAWFSACGLVPHDGALIEVIPT